MNCGFRRTLLSLWFGIASAVFLAGIADGQVSDKYIPEDAFAVVSFDTKSFAEIPGGDLFPHDLGQILVRDGLGLEIDIQLFKRLTWVYSLNRSIDESELVIGIIGELHKPEKYETLMAIGKEDLPVEREVIEGIEISQYDSGDLFVAQPEPDKILMGTQQHDVFLMAVSKKANKELRSLIEKSKEDVSLKVLVSIESLKDVINQRFQGLLTTEAMKLNELVRSIEIDVRLNKKTGFQIDATAITYKSQDAKSCEKSLKSLLKTANSITKLTKAKINDRDEYEVAKYSYLHQLTEIALKEIEIKQKGNSVNIQYENQGVALFAIGLSTLLN